MCDIIFQNVKAHTEDKNDYKKVMFTGTRTCILSLLQVTRGNVLRRFQPTLGNESLLEISNDNGVNKTPSCQEHNIPSSKYS